MIAEQITAGGRYMEEDLRKTAIGRYLQGETPKSIYKDLNRSKKWFFKWLVRYKSGRKNWYKDQSKAPYRRPNRIDDVERQRIIATRKRLESEPYAQTGASAIKWELRQSGHHFPSDRTIHRVLKREGLIKKKRLHPQRGRVSIFSRGA